MSKGEPVDKHLVRFDHPAVERRIANEEDLQRQLFEIIKRVQQHNFSLHRHAFRGTHVKTQGILKGTLTVVPDLPVELAQGICSAENSTNSHPIAIRFANEPSFLQDDRTPGQRGAGMKIFGVKGRFFDQAGEVTGVQDLTFNNAPILELRDLPTALEIFKIREARFRKPETIPDALKQRQDASLQLAPMELPNHHFLGYTMYSQSAYRWGPYVCKYALFPTGDLQARLAKDDPVTGASSPEQHSQWLREWFHSAQEATYDLRVQLLQDIKQQPIEDCSVEWDENSYPFRTVAKIVIPGHQNSADPERWKFWDDQMALNVWYGLEDHRPLGSANRLRKELYQRSVHFRESENAQKISQVTNIDDIP